MKRTEEEKKQDQEHLVALLNDPHIHSMIEYVHHKHSNRLCHVLNVTKMALKWAYIFGLKYDYPSLIRGALLHDYYPYDQNTEEERPKWHWIRHPRYALEHAKQDFELTPIEEDIIRNHMWPITLTHIPHTKEGWLVNLSDSIVTIHDFFKVGLKKNKELE